MENLIISTLLYIAIIAIAFAPKCPKKTATESAHIKVNPSAPINYFPEVEEETELETATDSLMYALMPIRKLYILAKDAGIKNYKAMSKSQLAIALSK
jgi:hypothetical protein